MGLCASKPEVEGGRSAGPPLPPTANLPSPPASRPQSTAFHKSSTGSSSQQQQQQESSRHGDTQAEARPESRNGLGRGSHQSGASADVLRKPRPGSDLRVSPDLPGTGDLDHALRDSTHRLSELIEQLGASSGLKTSLSVQGPAGSEARGAQVGSALSAQASSLRDEQPRSSAATSDSVLKAQLSYQQHLKALEGQPLSELGPRLLDCIATAVASPGFRGNFPNRFVQALQP